MYNLGTVVVKPFLLPLVHVKARSMHTVDDDGARRA